MSNTSRIATLSVAIEFRNQLVPYRENFWAETWQITFPSFCNFARPMSSQLSVNHLAEAFGSNPPATLDVQVLLVKG
jgi:hypothetical protein